MTESLFENENGNFAKPVLCSRCGLFSRKIQSEQVFFVFLCVGKNILINSL